MAFVGPNIWYVIVRASVGAWGGGFIFIILHGEASPLREQLAGMIPRWEDYHPRWEELREVKRLAFDEPFNWKIFMENSTDYYHIPFIHAETLELPPVIKNEPTGQHFKLTPITPEEEYKRFFDLVFPNMYFHVGPSKVQLFRVFPVTPARSRIDVFFYQTPEQAGDYPINDPRLHRDIGQILNEDFAICRVLQQQAASPAFRIRYTAQDLEEGVNHFDKMLLRSLALDDEGAA
ncbi:MAG: SRPBCC family protein, partial [Candidatus Competibacterales bacterium]